MLNLVGQPDRFQPVYNPINFYVDSDNKTQEGFKYLADVFSAGTSTRFARYRPAPRPVDGYGVIDINQVLASRVSFFRDQYQNIIADTPESYVDYDVEFGEEYVNYWRFYDNFDGSSTVSIPGGGLRSLTQAHTFEVGDQIYIQQDPGYTNEGYNGVHTVTYVPDQYSVLLDVAFSGSPANGGTAVYADRRKTTFTGPQEYLYNPNLEDNLILGANGWTEFGPDGCSVRLFINTNNSLTFSIPDASCGSINKSSINMFSAFTPGQTYKVYYTVSNINNPSSQSQYVRAHLGGTAGTTKVGTGYTEEYITCGTGTTFSLEFYMDADTGGFGAHSESVSGVSVTSNILISGYSAWNGAIKHQSLINYSAETYTMLSGTTNRFLTNVPNNYRLRPDNKMWINFHAETKNDAYGAILNTRYGQYVLLNLITGYTPSVYVLPCGPKNVTEVEGTTGSTGFYNWSNDLGTWPVFKNTCWEFDMVTSGPGIPATTILTNTSGEQSPWYNNFNDEAVDFYLNGVLTQAYIGATTGPNEVQLNFDYTAFTSTSGYIYQNTEEYSIYLIDITGGTSSETLNFNVERDVTRYSNIEIYFIDRLGSLICKNFELQNAQSIKVDRTEYQTLAGGLMNGKWNFLSTDRGRHVNNTTVVKQVELNAAFITEAESSYLQELISSPEVYIMEYGQLWPVVVKTNNYDVLTKLNKKNIPFKMTVEYANNDMVQNF